MCVVGEAYDAQPLALGEAAHTQQAHCQPSADAQACELFGLQQEELLAGDGPQELLAALLGELQHAHWCAAAGCSPRPAFATPLRAVTALRSPRLRLQQARLQRALAAARKRVSPPRGQPEPQR